MTRRLAPASVRTRIVFFGSVLYVFTLAAIWIDSRAYLARPFSSSNFARPLWLSARSTSSFSSRSFGGLRIGLLWISGLFAWLVARGQTSYPRWFALANPACLLIAVFLTTAAPPLGAYLVPAALNVAHVPFFLMSALIKRRPISAYHP